MSGWPARIVDAHHHLWDLQASHTYPWLMEKGVVRFFGDPAPIQRNYLVSDFRADIGALPVVASVHVQVGVAPGDEVLETLWLEAQGEKHGLPGAIVASCDLTRPDLEPTLEEHAFASRLRGVRQIVGRNASEDARTGSALLLDNPAFLEGLRLLARRGLSFDLQLTPGQMMKAAALLDNVPELPVALCHAGSLSDFSAEGRALWAEGLAALARLPNLICKLSGFGMFDHGWSAASVLPQFETVLDAFGPARMAFGSNFPVDSLYAGYADVWQRYRDMCAPLSEGERDQLFAATAARFYRLS